MPKKKKKIKKRKKRSKAKKTKAKVRKSPAGISNGVHRTRIRVIGIGGGGSSIVAEIAPQLKRVDFVAANTDRQDLKKMRRVVRTFQFGQDLTKGLGCGMNSRVGEKAVKKDSNKIAKLFRGIDLSILVATLGGGTSSGSGPEFAKIAKEMGVLTFGIFTLPFKFEGSKKMQLARASLERITPNLNAFCIIPNENIFKIIDKSTPIIVAFSSINSRLGACLKGLIEMVYLPGLINIDFADLKTILDGRGKLSYLNSATCKGQNKSEEAVKEVLKSPITEYGILGAEKIIYNITASQDLAMKEVERISQTIADFNKRAKIIFGISQDAGYKDKMRITLLAVGCGKKPKKEKPEPRLRQGSGGQAKPLSSVAPRAKEGKPRKRRKKRKKRKKPLPSVARKAKEGKPKPLPSDSASVATSAKGAARRAKEGNPKANPEESSTGTTRKNALDLRKEAEKTEKELLEQENQWDTPALLRKKQQ